jgi:hypothetical protein
VFGRKSARTAEAQIVVYGSGHPLNTLPQSTNRAGLNSLQHRDLKLEPCQLEKKR